MADALDQFLLKEQADTLEAMKSKLAHMQEKLDDEVKRSAAADLEKQALQRQLDMKAEGVASSEAVTASVASTQLMRVVEQWMRRRDLEEVMLRATALTDESFGSLVPCLVQSPSLHTLDLSDNDLSINSVADLSQLVTLVPDLSVLSVARNALPLNVIGYFMTAMLERQAKGLSPPVLINLQNNQGLLAEENHGTDALAMQERIAELCHIKVSLKSANLLVTVSKALWTFLLDTGHPEVVGKDESPEWGAVDQVTHGKMLEALRPIVLQEEVINGEPRSISAWMAIAEAVKVVEADEPAAAFDMPVEQQQEHAGQLDYGTQSSLAMAGASMVTSTTSLVPDERPVAVTKSKTFNLKQIVTKNGMILMNILERLLETTHIDARDVESNQTLLEYAARTGNMSLSKLCYRRGMNMSAVTASGDTAFTIATRNKNYALMEFLHMYGVKVNSADASGRTALHVATANNDVDGICRLIEWGADINLRDKKGRTPLHAAAIGGHYEVAMLLLELGADLNAKDDKDYTAVAHAEANDNFTLWERLIKLGGRPHRLQEADGAYARTGGTIGVVTQPKFMRKSVSLQRLGRLPVPLP